MNNLNQYPADDNQKELYKKFPSTHYLSTSTISSDFFKGLTDTGTGALNVLTNIVDKFGLLNTAAIGLGIFQGKNNSGESTWESPHAFFKTTYAA